MTKYLLIAAGMAAFIFGAYWAGGRIAAERVRAECAERIAANDVQNMVAVAAINAARIAAAEQTKRKIDAEIFNTATADIRGRLRAGYTIAD
ncbi:MAG: hypothetical protein FWE52_00395 [Alphaproteobacteria bacterium]|nr:hypothetical protein [Alphaproteobacteria bacterium]